MHKLCVVSMAMMYLCNGEGDNEDPVSWRMAGEDRELEDGTIQEV